MKTLVAMLGRMCLSLIFILAGAKTVMDWQGSQTFLLNSLCDLLNYTRESPDLQELMTLIIPWANAMLVIAVVFELLGGILLFFGVKVRFASFLLIIFLIPVTVICHHFWYLQGDDQQMQMTMFFRNLSIFGGLLTVLALGTGSSGKRREAKEEK